MAGLTSIILGTLATVGAGASVYSARQQAKGAKSSAKKQEQAQAKLKKDEERTKEQSAMRIRKRRGATSADPSTRSTILTGAGLGSAGAGGKQLLGT